jgi:hypothetical protein
MPVKQYIQWERRPALIFVTGQISSCTPKNEANWHFLKSYLRYPNHVPTVFPKPYSLPLHESLHGFRPGHGTGTASLNAKLQKKKKNTELLIYVLSRHPTWMVDPDAVLFREQLVTSQSGFRSCLRCCFPFPSPCPFLVLLRWIPFEVLFHHSVMTFFLLLFFFACS